MFHKKFVSVMGKDVDSHAPL